MFATRVRGVEERPPPLPDSPLSLTLFLSLSIRSGRRSSHGIGRAIYRGRYISLGEPLDFHTSASKRAYICTRASPAGSLQGPRLDIRSLRDYSRERDELALAFPFIDELRPREERGESVRRKVPSFHRSLPLPAPPPLLSGTDRPASGASHYHLGHFLFRGPKPRLNGARPMPVPARLSRDDVVIASGTVDTRD